MRSVRTIGKRGFDSVRRALRSDTKIVPAFLGKAGRVYVSQSTEEEFGQGRTRIGSPHIARRSRWRRVKVGIDELNCLIDAFRGKDAARERIEKTLRDLPRRALRDER